MRVRLIEKLWRHRIGQGIVDAFKESIDEGNHDAIKETAVELLNQAKKFYDPEEDDYVIDEINDLIQSVEDLDESSDDDDFDYVLSEIYDFCDGYGIFIGDGKDELVTIGDEEDEKEEDEKEEVTEARIVYDDEADYSNEIAEVAGIVSKWVDGISGGVLKGLTEYRGSMDRIKVSSVKNAIEQFIEQATSGSVIVSDNVKHAHGIGNNNAFEVLKVKGAEKEHIGFLHLVNDMYGGCFVRVTDNKNKLIGDRFFLSSSYINKNDKPLKRFKELR